MYGRKPQGGTLYEYQWPTFPGNHENNTYSHNNYYNYNRYNYGIRMVDDIRRNGFLPNAVGSCKERAQRGGNHYEPHASPSFKRQKVSENTWGSGGFYGQPDMYRYSSYNSLNESTRFLTGPGTSTSSHSTVGKRGRSDLEDEDCAALMSREEIERCSPSRKDGIDALHETRLRYSYCCFLHNLGMRLDLPQTTTGTAMVLCHRFFIRRSHACHDRFLIATAALFLAAKSEETSRPLNDVVKASCEILHNQDLNVLSYLLPIDWFEQYRERIIEAEQLMLTTLNFELSVQHPYDTLTSILNKLGVSHTHFMNLALSLVSEGFRSSLWLQFKPHQIAAGVAYVAAKMLNMNFGSCLSIWQEYQAPPPVLHDVAKQLMELFEE